MLGHENSHCKECGTRLLVNTVPGKDYSCLCGPCMEIVYERRKTLADTRKQIIELLANPEKRRELRFMAEGKEVAGMDWQPAVAALLHLLDEREAEIACLEATVKKGRDVTRWLVQAARVGAGQLEDVDGGCHEILRKKANIAYDWLAEGFTGPAEGRSPADECNRTFQALINTWRGVLCTVDLTRDDEVRDELFAFFEESQFVHNLHAAIVANITRAEECDFFNDSYEFSSKRARIDALERSVQRAKTHDYPKRIPEDAIPKGAFSALKQDDD